MQTYTGKKLEKPYVPNQEPRVEAYLPEKELVDAVNLAILLKRPLLLTGEPGCGKTRLAEALAFDLYPESYKDYFFRWDIKSISKAKDGLYRFKALEKLRDAQIDKLKEDENDYIAIGAMGKAFEKSTQDKRAILLIDEIDKADIDFPNDLLLELEQSEFLITETGKRIQAKYPPIIIITSNNEHENRLSPAFLRRCLYHHIKFPSREQLIKILNSHFENSSDNIIIKALEVFLEIRSQIAATDTEKSISTSELLDWFRVIDHCYKLRHDDNVNEYEQRLIEQLELLGTDKIPYKQVLLKNWASHTISHLK